MRKNVWMDPVVYCDNWSCQLPIVIPDMSETDYTRWALARLALSLYDNPLLATLSKRDQGRSVRRSLTILEHQIHLFGVIDVLLDIKDIGHTFLTNLIWFEGKLTFQHTEDMKRSPIFWAIATFERVLRTEGYTPFAVELVNWIYEWHVYLAKLPISRTDLINPEVSSWINRQKAPDFDAGPEKELLEAVQRVVSWLFTYRPDELVGGKHGPGSTYDGSRDVASKNAAFVRTRSTDQVLVDYPTPEAYFSGYGEEQQIHRSKLHVVDKNLGALRPITAMTSTLMYAQQMIKETIYHQTDDHVTYDQNLSHFVCFGKQELSRDLALKGSLDQTDGSPVTIDMKAASDECSLTLVKHVFKDKFLQDLLNTRSWGSDVPLVIPYETYIEHRMFDGMGSATTFPVQTMIFTAISLLATVITVYERDLGTAPESYLIALQDYLSQNGFRNGFRKWAKNIRVYGDDIIVPKFAADKTVEFLTRLGLRVNTKKSFYKNEAVREACGIFACAGHDITPLRFRIPVLKNNALVDYAALESLRQHANRAYILKYKHLRRGILRDLRTKPLLIGDKELRRKSRTTKHRIGNAVESLTQNFGDAALLYEGYCGEDHNYMGLISDSPSAFSHTDEIYGEVRGVFTTFSPVIKKTDVDKTSDFYFKNEQYRMWEFSELAFMEDHGKIPREIRLEKRNAILVPVRQTPDERKLKAWGWAPR